MSDILSKVERDIVLDWVEENRPELTATGKTFKIKVLSYSVQNETVCFDAYKAESEAEIEDGEKIEVQFYYKGRLLFFNSVFRRVDDGFCFSIDEKVSMFAETTKDVFYGLFCKILFPDCEKTDGTVCRANDALEVFTETDLASVFEKFSVMKTEDENSAIQNRAVKPILLFLSEKEMLVGCFGEFYGFLKNEKYRLEISVPQAGIERIINCFGTVSEIKTFPGEKERFAYLFTLSDLKMEDKRFLFEKHHGKKLR